MASAQLTIAKVAERAGLTRHTLRYPALVERQYTVSDSLAKP